MQLLYRILADVTVLIHVAYVTWVIAGLALFLIGGVRGWRWTRRRWVRYSHLAMIGIVVVESWLAITCPLTVWENELRRRAGQTGYRGDFIANCAHDLLFFDATPAVFTALYTLFGVAVVAAWWLYPPQK